MRTMSARNRWDSKVI